MTTYIRLPRHSPGDDITLDLMIKHTVKDVKSGIGRLLHIPIENQSLFLNGKPLQDGRTLADVNPKNERVLHMFLRFKSSIRVGVKASEGRGGMIDLDASDTVESVKRKIYEKRNVTPEHLELLIPGELIEDDQALAEYISKLSTRHVLVRVHTTAVMEIHQLSATDVPLCTLDVNGSCTVKEIKERLRDSQGIAVSLQKLHLGDKLLEDDCTMSSIGIEKSLILKLQLHAVGKAYVTAEALNGRQVVIPVLSSYACYRVLSLLESAIGVPTSQMHLKFDGKPLTLGSVSDYVPEQVATVVVRHRVDLKLFVESSTGEKFEVRIQPFQTVRDLKALIRDCSGHPAVHQRLFFKGKLLHDDRVIVNCFCDGLTNGSTIQLEGFLNVAMTTTWTFPVDNYETVGQLKAKIHGKYGYHISNQEIYLDGKILEDSSVLPQSIQAASKSCLILNVTMKITVKTLKNKVMNFTCNLTDTIRNLKEKIRQAEGYLTESQTLMFHLKKLEDDKTLMECGLEDGSCITLMA
ncbi:hypothetical protein FOL47_008835 [Perkinsus chesapeaki]|uniref:Ubiquitin-like domain-containing protein n=1 Tax=Perkinsus chesapeaki TaxID=330153 RepID=A0A7J6LBS3_PERCH|nr:hypothetical protein FOL47_008835 [Perkinsus chesapeaki]